MRRFPAQAWWVTTEGLERDDQDAKSRVSRYFKGDRDMFYGILEDAIVHKMWRAADYCLDLLVPEKGLTRGERIAVWQLLKGPEEP